MWHICNYLGCFFVHPVVARVAVYYLYHPYNHFALSRPQASINKWVDDEHKMNVQPACDDDGISHHMMVRIWMRKEKITKKLKMTRDETDTFHILILHDTFTLAHFQNKSNCWAIDFIIHYIPFVSSLHTYMQAGMNENLFYVIFIGVEGTFQCETSEWKKDTWGEEEVRKKRKLAPLNLFTFLMLYVYFTFAHGA